jgi:hypothetical protein
MSASPTFRAAPKKRLRFFAASVLSLAFSASAYATPLLRCHVSYAGSTEIIEAQPSKDPYTIESINIGERFRFKAVMIGSGEKIEYIKLYAYFQARHKDIMIHQATYLPPFKTSQEAITLTPHNHLYASDVERELQYHCTLQGVQP